MLLSMKVKIPSSIGGQWEKVMPFFIGGKWKEKIPLGGEAMSFHR